MPQVAYSSDLGRLLGVRGDRPPNRCSTNKRDELPPLHSTLPQLEDTGPRYQVSWLIACNSEGMLRRTRCGRLRGIWVKSTHQPHSDPTSALPPEADTRAVHGRGLRWADAVEKVDGESH